MHAKIAVLKQSWRADWGVRGVSRQASLSDGFQNGGRLTSAAQSIWKEVIQPGDAAVDATCGHGRDAACLAQLLAPTGKLFCFDIQDTSMTSTKHTLERQAACTFPGAEPDLISGASADGVAVQLIRRSHAEMETFVNRARVVCFNLGYLPSGDKDVTTTTESTIAAVEAAMRILEENGVITVMAYPGHAEGKRECDALRLFCAELPSSDWLVSEFQILNRRLSPILITLWKL